MSEIKTPSKISMKVKNFYDLTCTHEPYNSPHNFLLPSIFLLFIIVFSSVLPCRWKMPILFLWQRIFLKSHSLSFFFFWKTIKDFIQWRLKIEFEYKKSKENFNTQMKFNSINFSQFFQKLYKKYLTCFSINLCTLFWFFLQSYMCEALEPKINTKEKFKGAQKKRKREEEENLCSGQAYTHFDILLDWMIFSSLLQQNSRYIEKARNKKKKTQFSPDSRVWNTTKIFYCCYRAVLFLSLGTSVTFFEMVFLFNVNFCFINIERNSRSFLEYIKKP